MACSACDQLQQQQTNLRNAITQVADPLTLLHSLVSILAPEGARMADAAVSSQEPVKSVLKGKDEESGSKS